jgi:4-hydroxy-tetrahydrodipicolinate reductase
MHKVAVAGASGRMGHMLIEAIRASGDCQLSGATDQPSTPAIGNDAAAFLGLASGVPVTADIRAALANTDVLIDFTRPEGTMEHVRACREMKVNLVIGTTGFSEGQKAQIEDAARDIAIMMAPNMSIGVNVTLKLLELAAKSLGTGYDVEVIESHHRHKVDAPSGTALKMGEVIAKAQGQQLKDCAVYAREGVTGERKAGTIGFSAIRGGDIVGDHTVLFAGTGEQVTLGHRATDRAVFARGALRAALWLAGQSPGRYFMRDFIGLKTGA